MFETNQIGLGGNDHTLTDDGAGQVRQCACGAGLVLNVEGAYYYFNFVLGVDETVHYAANMKSEILEML